MMATVVQELTKPLGPGDAGTPMTMDEFEQAEYELGYRYELMNGLLIVNPPPREEERDANQVLGQWLLNYQEDHPSGKSLDLTLPEHNIYIAKHQQNRRADRVIWAGLGRRLKTRGLPRRSRDVPTIVVEFPSRRPADQRRDYVEKKGEYRDAGIEEYWIIDRFRRHLTVYRWRGKRWAKQTYHEDETYRTPILPGFELPLAKLLAVSDKYAGDE